MTLGPPRSWRPECDHLVDDGDRCVVERLVGWAAAPHGGVSEEDAEQELAGAEEAGFDILLREHRAAWAAWWDDAAVTIEGDADAQLATRFALHHLLAAVPDRGRRPAGRTAMHVLEVTTKPVVVVPPNGERAVPNRLLVPLEGAPASSQPVLERLVPMLAIDAELVVVHVFTSETMPRVLDRPVRDLELWGDEFVARFCPQAAAIRLRTGVVATQIDEVAAEEAAGLVVLSWSRDMSHGHAEVIRQVLADSEVPVLLLPVLEARPS